MKPVLSNRIGDLSDSLNPILFKELQQQLRSSVFVWALLSVQLGMATLSLIGLCTKIDPIFLRAFYWIILNLWLFGLNPLRALGIVRAEYYQNTLDPLLLTRLSPRKIVFGKWSAIVLQTCIVITSILPYFIVTYLLGGDEILSDLYYLTMYFIASLPFVSLMIAVSTNRKVLYSAGLFYVFIPGLGITGLPLAMLFAGLGILLKSPSLAITATIISVSILMSAFMLTAATKQDDSIFSPPRVGSDNILLLLILWSVPLLFLIILPGLVALLAMSI
jgi:hypothetical protein